MNPLDIVGTSKNRWKIVEYVGIEERIAEVTGNLRKSHIYLCKCKCGTMKKVTRGGIMQGGVKSCGCLARQKSRAWMYGGRFVDVDIEV